MKFVRLSLIISSLLALSACCSWSELRQFHARPAKPVEAPPVQTVSADTQPAAAAPSAPETPAPAPITPPAAPVAPVTVAAPVAPVVAETPAAEPALRVTRTGARVALSWTLPPSADGYRAIEVMRNNSETPKGRSRVKAVRASVTQYEDTLADAADHAWYWLKLTDPNNNITNLGPVEAAETAR